MPLSGDKTTFTGDFAALAAAQNEEIGTRRREGEPQLAFIQNESRSSYECLGVENTRTHQEMR